MDFFFYHQLTVPKIILSSITDSKKIHIPKLINQRKSNVSTIPDYNSVRRKGVNWMYFLRKTKKLKEQNFKLFFSPTKSAKIGKVGININYSDFLGNDTNFT